MSKDPIVIASACRTAMGAFQGALSSLKATELGAHVIKDALNRVAVKGEDVDEVLMGCVLPAGQGQAPARQAAIGAGLPNSVGCATVNKVCGSSMKTIMMAHDSIAAGTNKIVVAGGMESMTNAPYLLPNARSGYRLGHGQVIDHMVRDGLEDAYSGHRHMGTFAEDTAEKYKFTREDQDGFALESLRRANQAIDESWFKEEITPVTYRKRRDDVTVSEDESPKKAMPDKIPSLRPVFRDGGTVTAANASSISDGAAATVLMRSSEAESRGLKPLAKIVGFANHAHEPCWFTTAPVGAMEKLMQKIGWSIDTVDLFEINEAFAVVAMAAIHDLKIPHEKVNVNGGACALGHPIGATGSRLVVTLIHALKRLGKKRGIASLCIGGGEATAIAIEIL